MSKQTCSEQAWLQATIEQNDEQIVAITKTETSKFK